MTLIKKNEKSRLEREYANLRFQIENKSKKNKNLKACVLYFLHLTKRKHFKNYEKLFLFHLKDSLHSRDINFFVIFFFLFTVSIFKGSDEAGIIMTSRIGLRKLANVIFGITQKPFCIRLSKLPR